MPPRPEQPVVTFKCEGCGQRGTAPAPYGGDWHTACSIACLVRAIDRSVSQEAARRARVFARRAPRAEGLPP